MLGNDEVPGLITLCLNHIFEKKQQLSEKKVHIKVSYVEIYNEYIRDLLIPKENKTYCSLRDDPIKGVTIAGANCVEVDEPENIM